jgi:hypothetical protein
MPLVSIGRIENRIFVPRDPIAYLRRYYDKENWTAVEILKKYSPPASANNF